MLENQFLILNIIKDVSLMGSGFFGIQTEAQLL